MATAARERLAEILGRAAGSVASGVLLTAGTDDLRLEVEGIGQLQFPVSARQAQRLCQLGRPARFGRGEETLIDPEIRDTCEIPANLVRAEWGGVFSGILGEVREKLGLSPGCDLLARFHSMLVYGPGQFFAAHQDSEVDDTMIATLVVTLPSAYSGGELRIGHGGEGGEGAAYRGSETELTLVAFYADRSHEILPVTSGYRITLTYNLLLTGDTRGPTAEDEAVVGELACCLGEHFSTTLSSDFSGAERGAVLPVRLVYLLDHEYTARGLSWSRLKGADATRVSLLRAAAYRAGCEAVLALAAIREQWEAYEPEPMSGQEDWEAEGGDAYREYMSGQEDWDAEGGDAYREYRGSYDLQELLSSQVELTRWNGSAGDGPEDISLRVRSGEVCATTRSVDLWPYASEYTGWMGNHGNTMDRWYRRAALVICPDDRSFVNRAEALPGQAVDALTTLAHSGDVAGARATAATLVPYWALAPFWEQSERSWLLRTDPEFLSATLRAAAALDDADTARMLLHPFCFSSLRSTHAAALVKLSSGYGERWTDDLLRTWSHCIWCSPWFRDSGGRPPWVAESMPSLCEALIAEGGPGKGIAHRLLNLLADWVARIERWVDEHPGRPLPERWHELGGVINCLHAVMRRYRIEPLPGQRLVSRLPGGPPPTVAGC